MKVEMPRKIFSDQSLPWLATSGTIYLAIGHHIPDTAYHCRLILHVTVTLWQQKYSGAFSNEANNFFYGKLSLIQFDETSHNNN